MAVPVRFSVLLVTDNGFQPLETIVVYKKAIIFRNSTRKLPNYSITNQPNQLNQPITNKKKDSPT